MAASLADKLIETSKQKAFSGEMLSPGEIVSLLELKGNDIERLKRAAREVAAALTGNRCYLWGAIGLDYGCCRMNCDFCSLGEKWGLVKDAYTLREEDIISRVRDYAANGVRWVTLRTTEFYPVETLCGLCEKIRSEVPGKYELGLNTGELDAAAAVKLSQAGCDFVYHALRLGEGQNTRFDPKNRLDVLRIIKESPLDLMFCVEPIGPEHTNEEIAAICACIAEHGAKVSGVMARVPVEGTPLGQAPQISEERLAHITAVTRLACANAGTDISAHPASEICMSAGANVAVIDSGAIPRSGEFCQSEWKGFTIAQAKEWFTKQNYQIGGPV